MRHNETEQKYHGVAEILTSDTGMTSRIDPLTTAPRDLAIASATRPRGFVGAILILASAMLFAANGIAVKTILGSGQISATRLVSLRTLLAAVVLVSVLAVMRPRELRPGWPALVRLAILGLFGIGLLQWSYFNHLQRLPVAVGMTIQYMAPVAVAVLARFVFGEAVRRRVWLALGLTLAGVALMLGVAEPISLALDPIGLAFAIGAMVALTIYYLMGERSLALVSPLATQTWMIVFAAALWQVVTPIWTFDWTVLGAPISVPGATPDRTMPLWVPLTFLVLAGTVAAYLLVMVGIKRIGATRAGLLGMAEPVIVAVLGWLLLGEMLTGWQMAGVGIAVSGMALAATSRRRGVRATDASGV